MTEKTPDDPEAQLNADEREKELLKYSNDIRLQNDLTVIEVRFAG